MNLLVDVGNSRIKWACQDEDGVSPGTGTKYDKLNFAALAHTHWGKMASPRRMLVANVAGGGLGEQISAWVIRRWRITPEFLLPERQAFGVTNAYADPSQLGADRWACLLAAHHQISGPACIVDCGTATTIDVLSDTGQHMGGLILPGIQMMRQSLICNTSQIPGEKLQENPGTLDLGQSTQQAVENGCLYSTVATIERVISEVTEQLGSAVTTVITGGDTDRVVPLLSIDLEQKPDFVLQGLAIAAGVES
ncbi:MAG: type III pantothenate kinase [Gammaproteobacteria bacterium]